MDVRSDRDARAGGGSSNDRNRPAIAAPCSICVSSVDTARTPVLLNYPRPSTTQIRLPGHRHPRGLQGGEQHDRRTRPGVTAGTFAVTAGTFAGARRHRGRRLRAAAMPRSWSGRTEQETSAGASPLRPSASAATRRREHPDAGGCAEGQGGRGAGGQRSRGLGRMGQLGTAATPTSQGSLAQSLAAVHRRPRAPRGRCALVVRRDDGLGAPSDRVLPNHGRAFGVFGVPQ
jgi:hypothetical protein